MNRDHLAWQAQSLLLGYPDEDLAARVPLLRRVASTVDEPVGTPLHRFLDHVASTPVPALAAAYVATFDHRRRCCPYLTYYAHGDTRRRGVALLRLKQRYAAAGMRLCDDELPDHLAVMLEFASAASAASSGSAGSAGGVAGGVAGGRPLLTEHRAGIELLRLALREAGAPWALVLDSVSATLPSLGADERLAVARLAAEGPPAEEVGLAPFAPPEYMPDPQGASR